MTKKLKSFSVGLIKSIIAIGLLIWLLRSGKLDLVSLKKVLSPSSALIFLVLILINSVFLSERWRALLTCTVGRFSFWQTAQLTMMGFFFNFAMPGGVGGDFVKGYFLIKNSQNKKTEALVAILLDRVIGLYCMILVATLMMTLDLNQVLTSPILKVIYSSLVVLSVSITALFGVAFSKRLQPKMEPIFGLVSKIPFLGGFVIKIYRALTSFGNHQNVIVRTGVYSVIAQLFAVSIFYFVGQSLNFHDIPLGSYWIIPPIAFIITALPITPGGVGIGQAAFSFLFELYRPGSGIVGSTGVTVLQIGYFILGLYGAYYFSTHKQKEFI